MTAPVEQPTRQQRVNVLITDALRQYRASGRSGRRHPAEVTADRLGDAVTRWPDSFTPGERDMVGQIIDRLRDIAEGVSDAR